MAGSVSRCVLGTMLLSALLIGLTSCATRRHAHPAGKAQSKLPEVAVNDQDDRRSEVHVVAFSPDGKWIANGSYDGTARIWDSHTGRLVRTLKGTTLNTDALVFSRDARTLAMGNFEDSADNYLTLWDVDTGRKRKAIPLYHGVLALAISPDGRALASSTFDYDQKAPQNVGEVDLWTYPALRHLRRYKLPDQVPTSLAYSPDGRTIAANPVLKDLVLLLAARGGSKRILTGARLGADCIAYSPDGAAVAGGGGTPGGKTISGGRAIRYPSRGETVLWAAGSGTVVKRLSTPGHWVRAMAYSPDGRLLATGGGEGDIMLWDARTGKIARKLRAHKGAVRGLAFSSDGKRLVSGCDRHGEDWSYTHGDMKIWDVASGRLIATFVVLNSNDWIVYTPQGHYDASNGAGAYLGWRAGKRVVSFKEYARRYRRPDLLKKALSP